MHAMKFIKMLQVCILMYVEKVLHKTVTASIKKETCKVISRSLVALLLLLQSYDYYYWLLEYYHYPVVKIDK